MCLHAGVEVADHYIGLTPTKYQYN
jgi:hypothetical protein